MDLYIALELHFNRMRNDGSTDYAVDPIEYDRANTYDELQSTWRDSRKLPTEGQLQAAWNAYQQQHTDAEAKKQARNAEVVRMIKQPDSDFNIQIIIDAGVDDPVVEALLRKVNDLSGKLGL